MLSDGPPRRLRVVRVSKILASPLANRLRNGVSILLAVVGQVERRVDVLLLDMIQRGVNAVSAAVIAIDFITSRVWRDLIDINAILTGAGIGAAAASGRQVAKSYQSAGELNR